MNTEDYVQRYNNYLGEYFAARTKAEELIGTFEGSYLSDMFSEIVSLLLHFKLDEDTVREQIRQRVINEAKAEFSDEIENNLPR